MCCILLLPIRTCAVYLTEFAGPRNRVPSQTFNVQAGLGHLYFAQVISYNFPCCYPRNSCRCSLNANTKKGILPILKKKKKKKKKKNSQK